MKLFFLALFFPFAAQAACIQVEGVYRVAGHPTAIVEYKQVGCEVTYVRESKDGITFTEFAEHKMDGAYRRLPRGTFFRGWFEGNQMRYQYFHFDKKTNQHISYVDHWNEFDSNGDLLAWEKLYDLNGNFERDWSSRFVRKTE